MNATNNYLFKYIILWNSILFENQGVTEVLNTKLVGNSLRFLMVHKTASNGQ
jgi:hypothetical protein